jgi:hypothetical protein
MGRTVASFGRGKPSFKAQPTVLIVCEDSKSSLKYLRDAKTAMRVLADVEIDHPGKTNPLGIVKHAVGRRSKYDFVYCVIDRDTHEDFDEAMGLARSSNVQMIVSYPCFEYWLLLHFKYSRKAYSPVGKKSPGDQMMRALKDCEGMGDYEKGSETSLFKKLEGGALQTARKHAERALAAAIAEDEFNPSTTLHTLISEFERLAAPQRV